MGLAQAVSLPRGGGTLKAQRPLPAAVAAAPTSMPGPPTSPGDLWRSGWARRQSGGVQHGAKARGARAMEPSRHEVRATSAIGRLGRTGRSARRGPGVGEARTGSSADEGRRGGERSSEWWQGIRWVPRTSLGDSARPGSSVPAYSGTRRKDEANHDQKKQCFLGSNQGGLPGGGSSALGLQRQANRHLRDEGKCSRIAKDGPGRWNNYCDLGTDFAKGSSSTSPWQGPRS